MTQHNQNNANSTALHTAHLSPPNNHNGHATLQPPPPPPPTTTTTTTTMTTQQHDGLLKSSTLFAHTAFKRPKLHSVVGSPLFQAKKKSESAGGSSCHQCKSRRNYGDLTYCTSSLNKKNKNAVCRKKYCEHCLKKFYREPALPPSLTGTAVMWKCPSCRKICCCAACRRRESRDHNDEDINGGGAAHVSGDVSMALDSISADHRSAVDRSPSPPHISRLRITSPLSGAMTHMQPLPPQMAVNANSAAHNTHIITERDIAHRSLMSVADTIANSPALTALSAAANTQSASPSPPPTVSSPLAQQAPSYAATNEVSLPISLTSSPYHSAADATFIPHNERYDPTHNTAVPPTHRLPNAYRIGNNTAMQSSARSVSESDSDNDSENNAFTNGIDRETESADETEPETETDHETLGILPSFALFYAVGQLPQVQHAVQRIMTHKRREVQRRQTQSDRRSLLSDRRESHNRETAAHKITAAAVSLTSKCAMASSTSRASTYCAAKSGSVGAVKLKAWRSSAGAHLYAYAKRSMSAGEVRCGAAVC